MNKPFHLMTPAEKTALRIAQNRAIAERVAEKQAEPKNAKPPASSSSSGDFTRTTPGERGGVIRKVQR
jgi:hypothetical protein